MKTRYTILIVIVIVSILLFIGMLIAQNERNMQDQKFMEKWRHERELLLDEIAQEKRDKENNNRNATWTFGEDYCLEWCDNDELYQMGCDQPILTHITKYSNLLDDDFDGEFFIDLIGLPDGVSKEKFEWCVDIILEKRIKLLENTESNLMPLDIANVEDKYVQLNPTDMCATVSLRLLSSDDLKQTKSGTKDVVFFELDDQSMNKFPILGELIRATHHIESPLNEHAQTEIGLREFVDYEFFIMGKAITKYNDTQDDYFLKLDGNLDEKLADPKKQGFSNEFIVPQIVYNNKTYTMGSTVFWTADEHEMQSVSIRLQENLKEDEKYVTLTDKDMDSVPKIKQTIEKIGTELESIVAFKGMPENPDWNNYREWFDQKKIEQFDLDDVYVKGFVHEGEYYDLGFLIC